MAFTQNLLRAFQAGEQARQAEEQQAREREERELRIKVLKHNMDREKIEQSIADQKMARGAALENFNLMQTQRAPEQVLQGQGHTVAGQFGPINIPSITSETISPGLPPQTIPGIDFAAAGLPGIPNVQGLTLTPPSIQDQLADFERKKRLELQIEREKNTYTIPGFDQPVPSQAIAPLINSKASAERQSEQQLFTSRENEKRLSAQERIAEANRDAAMARTRIAAASREAAARTGKPPTEGERRAFGFHQRIVDAEQAIDQLSPEIAAMGIAGQARLSYAPNFAQSDTGQLYRQAADNFINAALRRESGAAIGQSEYDRFNRIYFPRPGDTQDTLKQKARARQIVINSLKTESGRAYQESAPSSGDATEFDFDPATGTLAPRKKK